MEGRTEILQHEEQAVGHLSGVFCQLSVPQQTEMTVSPFEALHG